MIIMMIMIIKIIMMTILIILMTSMTRREIAGLRPRENDTTLAGPVGNQASNQSCKIHFGIFVVEKYTRYICKNYTFEIWLATKLQSELQKTLTLSQNTL